MNAAELVFKIIASNAQIREETGAVLLALVGQDQLVLNDALTLLQRSMVELLGATFASEIEDMEIVLPGASYNK